MRIQTSMKEDGLIIKLMEMVLYFFKTVGDIWDNGVKTSSMDLAKKLGQMVLFILETMYLELSKERVFSKWQMGPRTLVNLAKI